MMIIGVCFPRLVDPSVDRDSVDNDGNANIGGESYDDEMEMGWK